ncbi:MAG: hypothetical protein ACE5I1_00370 [bacterium]
MQEQLRMCLKTLLLYIIVIWIIPANSFAQNKKQLLDSTLVTIVIDSLASKLALSDSQSVEVKKIIVSYANELKEITEKYGDDREILTLMQNNIQERRDRKIESILNREQRKNLELVKIEIANTIKKIRRKSRKTKNDANE